VGRRGARIVRRARAGSVIRLWRRIAGGARVRMARRVARWASSARTLPLPGASRVNTRRRVSRLRERHPALLGYVYPEFELERAKLAGTGAVCCWAADVEAQGHGRLRRRLLQPWRQRRGMWAGAAILLHFHQLILRHRTQILRTSTHLLLRSTGIHRAQIHRAQIHRAQIHRLSRPFNR